MLRGVTKGIAMSEGHGHLTELLELVMGPGEIFLTRVRSIFCGSGRVSHLWFGFGFQKFPQKMSKFLIFSLQVKKNLFGSGQNVPRSKAVGQK